MEAQEDAAQRQLLRLHGHAEEQDPGDLRRARTAATDGKVKHRPFHSYTMKQAIQEGFILDVLKDTDTGEAIANTANLPMRSSTSTSMTVGESTARWTT